MSDNKEHKRDDSYSQGYRREIKWRRKSNEPITDQNTSSFIAEAMKNGLNLIAIAAAAAARKEKKEEE